MIEAVLCLALNVYFEARSEPINSQFAVAEVTMNRVKSNAYPDSVCEVVWQRKQFSWTHDGKSDKPKNSYAWRLALAVAKSTLSDTNGYTSQLPPNTLHYHADYVSPYWVGQYKKVGTIGRHIFYKKETS